MSGVTGPLWIDMQGDSEVVLLLSPKEGGALNSGTVLDRADKTVGESRILVAGDIPIVISFIGLSIDESHEPEGISSAG